MVTCEMRCMPFVYFLLVVIMKRGRDIAAFFAPVNKKVRETYQGI